MSEAAATRTADHEGEADAPIWYARPVFFVSDIKRSLEFYLGQLGFVMKWGEGWDVCQVDRGDCEIILCQDAARRDRSRIFLELNRSGLAELLGELEARSVPKERTWWGYDVERITDPDGNELLVCLEF